MSRYNIAQINVGRIRAELDDPIMAGFVNRLDEINALADAVALGALETGGDCANCWGYEGTPSRRCGCGPLSSLGPGRNRRIGRAVCSSSGARIQLINQAVKDIVEGRNVKSDAPEDSRHQCWSALLVGFFRTSGKVSGIAPDSEGLKDSKKRDTS